MYNRRMNTQLAEKIRSAEQLTLSDKIKLIRDLSIPGILAVITETVMGFIDTAMVGALGALASASIGLVMSSTWLFGELINSVSIGFSVQVAHAVGAGKLDRSRRIFKGSILTPFDIFFDCRNLLCMGTCGPIMATSPARDLERCDRLPKFICNLPADTSVKLSGEWYAAMCR